MWFPKLPPKTVHWQLLFSTMRYPQRPFWLRSTEAQCPPVPGLPPPPAFPCCLVVAVIVKTHSGLSSGFSGRLRERARAFSCSHRCTRGFYSGVGELGRWAEQCHVSPHTHTHTPSGTWPSPLPLSSRCCCSPPSIPCAPGTSPEGPTPTPRSSRGCPGCVCRMLFFSIVLIFSLDGTQQTSTSACLHYG